MEIKADTFNGLKRAAEKVAGPWEELENSHCGLGEFVRKNIHEQVLAHMQRAASESRKDCGHSFDVKVFAPSSWVLDSVPKKDNPILKRTIGGTREEVQKQVDEILTTHGYQLLDQ